MCRGVPENASIGGMYPYGFDPYYAAAIVGQATDHSAEWEQILDGETHNAFRAITGRSYPDNLELRIVWYSLKYELVTLILERARSKLSEMPYLHMGPKGPFSTRAVIQWLVGDEAWLRRLFAENPTWRQRGQEALQRLRSAKTAAASGWYC